LGLGSHCDCRGRVHEKAEPSPFKPTPLVPLEQNRPLTCAVSGDGVRCSPDTTRGATADTVAPSDLPMPQPGDPASCSFCGADGVVGERLIVHQPDCWHGGMLDLYSQEAGS